MPAGALAQPILLVEESPSDRELLQRAFGASTTAVADAAAALEAVRRHAYAAIVLAQALPRRSGLDMLRELRAAGDATPVVLMLEHADAELGAEALRAGAAAYTVKAPGFDADLPAVVARVMAGPRPASDASRARDVLVVEVDGQRHGFFAADVEAVTGAVEVAALPGAPPDVEGAMVLHGRMIPVVDFRRRLGLTPRPVLPSDHFVVLRGADVAAVRVDRAEALAHAEAVVATDEDAVRGMLAGVAAVVRLGDHTVFVHDTADVVRSLRDLGTAERRR
jgi:purine-binding chemotaxis protein CheW